MTKSLSALAVIPARAGSKRFPNKNVAPLLGKPLVAWSIEAALGAAELTEIMVSTDSREIGDIAEALGATVPGLRPPRLASDDATTVDVVIDVVETYAAKGQHFDAVCVLQPTSPLRTSSDIDRAFALFKQRDADAVISVSPVDHPPAWSNVLPPDGSLTGFIRPEYQNVRSQDLPPYYRLNGAIYLVDVQRLLKERTLFFATKIFAAIMPRENSIDIDHEADLYLAESLLKAKGVGYK